MDLAVSIAVPLGLGLVTAALTREGSTGAWYASLKKPRWMPPRAAFPIVWTVLYVAMGVAAHRVWAAGGGAVPLGLYALQLALNIAWSFVFFNFQNVGAAMLNIALLWGAVAATAVSFYLADPLAGHLMLPYLAWVSLATALTANLYVNNA